MQSCLFKHLISVALGTITTTLMMGQDAMDPFLVEMNAFTVYADSTQSTSAPAVQLGDRMAREIRVDLQSRGGIRYQTDISIRGGIFEGTGLMVGGLALFDPQTGHYFSEIPLDPAFFGGAYLLTGVANGVHGFNSTAGTINWDWKAITEGGSAYGRLGTNALRGGGLRTAGRMGKLSYELSAMHEKGDGSIDFSDFDIVRLSGRSEVTAGNATMRVFGGYLDKFYGWPGMYTGFSLNETEDYSVALLGWQVELDPDGTESRHRIGGYWREVDDDYEFSRESPNTFFEHKTEVFSLQGDGRFIGERMDIVYRWTLVSDRIIRSTSLTNGDFSERDYGEGSVLGRKSVDTSWGEWTAYGGMALNTSNHDSTVGLPQAGLRATGFSGKKSWTAYIEYSQSSQVPGYTVLNSAPSGLFGGNKLLGREKAGTFEAGYTVQAEASSGKIVIFQRRDRSLVDWVYDSSTPTARQAKPVDIDVSGIETWLGWQGETTAIQIGYIWLDKDETYLESGADASFYALNYARQRMLLTLDQGISNTVQFRLEVEWREHPGNALRTMGDEALRLNAELSWNDALESGWDLLVRGTNLTRDDFQDLPGTAGPGREVFATLARDW